MLEGQSFVAEVADEASVQEVAPPVAVPPAPAPAASEPPPQAGGTDRTPPAGGNGGGFVIGTDLSSFIGGMPLVLPDLAPSAPPSAFGQVGVSFSGPKARLPQPQKRPAFPIGGQGLSPLHKLVFEQEEMPFGMPMGYFGVSLGISVPVVMRFAQDRDWAKERVLAALKGDEIWCQLFSEPSGGSDLAGLRTKAEPDGNGWKLNGQKLWTTWAQHSDYGVIIARNDPTAPKHKGLTFFWVAMKAPGVTVRPFRLAAGDSHVNEVFFDDVKLSDDQRLSPVGGGFATAIATLAIERYSASDPAGFGPPLDLFVELAREA